MHTLLSCIICRVWRGKYLLHGAITITNNKNIPRPSVVWAGGGGSAYTRKKFLLRSRCPNKSCLWRRKLWRGALCHLFAKHSKWINLPLINTSRALSISIWRKERNPLCVRLGMNKESRHLQPAPLSRRCCSSRSNTFLRARETGCWPGLWNEIMHAVPALCAP